MDNKRLENVSYNYFLNNASYAKTILNLLPDNSVSTKKKALIMELFNYILGTLSNQEEVEIIRVSRAFEEKLSVAPISEKRLQAEYLYKNFLEKMLFDSFNRIVYFNIMNECIKTYTDYYQEYQDNNSYMMSDNGVNNIRIK